jgi:hypothetical protein
MYVWQELCYVTVNFECYETWPFGLSGFMIRCTWRLANSNSDIIFKFYATFSQFWQVPYIFLPLLSCQCLLCNLHSWIPGTPCALLISLVFPQTFVGLRCERYWSVEYWRQMVAETGVMEFVQRAVLVSKVRVSCHPSSVIRQYVMTSTYIRKVLLSAFKLSSAWIIRAHNLTM